MDSYEYDVYKNRECTHVKIYISLKIFLYVQEAEFKLGLI